MPKVRPGFVRLRILVPILLAISTGCAYYNTFYLARRYYKDAQKEQDRSVSDAVSVGASTKFDQAARQCTKVIQEYPKSKWADDAMYLLGASLYGKGDYPNAIRRLNELEVKYPKSPFIPEARLVKGMAHYRRKDYDSADSLFRALAAEPKLHRKWELYFYAGENRVAQKDYAGGLWWYRRAVELGGERREKADALRRTADALAESDRPDSAQLVYAQALKEEERPKFRLDVILARAEALRDLKRYAEALDFLNRWRGTAVAEQREGELLLRVYEMQGLLGRTNDALKGYQNLVERFPNTNVAYESQFQIGYLYETALGNLEQAGREYDKLRSLAGGNNVFAQQALRRSQSLQTVKQFEQAMAADTTGARARTAFRLAEVLYFELAKTDSALAQYRSVETEFPKSVYAPKSAYARLWITAFDRKDTLAAMQLTDSIAARYRGTRYAESALYLWKQWSGRTDMRTALFDSLLAHPDTSAAATFAEETEKPSSPPTSVVPPTSSAPDSGYQVSPALLKQLEEQRNQLLKSRANNKPGQQAPADTTHAVPPPPPRPPSSPDSTQSAPADTSRTRTAPADTTRSTAPPDTTRSGTRR